MEAGSEEAKKTEEQMWNQARKTVQHTIDYTRGLAKEGKLGKGLKLEEEVH